MFKLISIRCKGGSTKYEDMQMEAMAKQQVLDKQMEGIDLEYYEMRQENKRLYDTTIRPEEESMLRRAAGPAREATSARGRAAEYAAADEASSEALQRRNDRMGISNGSAGPQGDDDYIRAIALTAVGNQSKMSALETQSKLQQASMGIGTGVNQDIGRAFGQAASGMQQGIGHADAAFSNYSNAQGHMNNAYLAKQQGNSAMIGAATSVVGMGISNYNTAATNNILAGTPDKTGWGSAFSGGGGTW